MEKYLEVKGIRYKSKGEYKIAKFLDELDINFEYEFPISIIDNDNKHRVWYPDFYLKDFQIVIEYFGMSGNKEYDKGTEHKKNIFKRCGIELIEIYPKNLEEINLIINKITKLTLNKQNKIFKINENIKKKDLWKKLRKIFFNNEIK